MAERARRNDLQELMNVAGEVQQFENLDAEFQKVRAVAFARAIEIDLDGAFDAARTGGHDDDAIAHVDRFVDVMRDEDHRRAARFPEAQHFILHFHASECIERAERFIQQENFRMIDQRSRKGDALRHAAGKLMRIGVGERLESNEAHEIVHLTALLMQNTASDQTRFDVATHSKPRK